MQRSTLMLDPTHATMMQISTKPPFDDATPSSRCLQGKDRITTQYSSLGHTRDEIRERQWNRSVDIKMENVGSSLSLLKFQIAAQKSRCCQPELLAIANVDWTENTDFTWKAVNDGWQIRLEILLFILGLIRCV
jgi:hypothetical protein